MSAGRRQALVLEPTCAEAPVPKNAKPAAVEMMVFRAARKGAEPVATIAHRRVSNARA